MVHAFGSSAWEVEPVRSQVGRQSELSGKALACLYVYTHTHYTHTCVFADCVLCICKVPCVFSLLGWFPILHLSVVCVWGVVINNLCLSNPFFT